MRFENPTPEEMKNFLKRVHTIAVVGISLDPDRPSYSVSMFMQSRGYHIVPVRPDGGEVLGEKIYKSLADIPFPVDAVDIFRDSRFVAGHVDEALAIKAPAVWLQEGVIDEAAAERAKAAGVFVVMDRCILKEYRKARL